ncbi:glycine cleavage system protein H [Pseudomonas azerbaijanoccidentalis]|jgi:glycine cleavage system H protein
MTPQSKRIRTLEDAMNFTGARLFSKNHIWVQSESGTYSKVLGVTNYALDNLGDIKFITFEESVEIDSIVQEGQTVFSLESAKSSLEFISPVAGELVQINPALDANPQIINKSPENEGWILRLRLKEAQLPTSLMTQEKYNEYLKGI